MHSRSLGQHVDARVEFPARTKHVTRHTSHVTRHTSHVNAPEGGQCCSAHPHDKRLICRAGRGRYNRSASCAAHAHDTRTRHPAPRRHAPHLCQQLYICSVLRAPANGPLGRPWALRVQQSVTPVAQGLPAMLRRSVTVYMGSVLHRVVMLLACDREAWCAINDVQFACRVGRIHGGLRF